MITERELVGVVDGLTIKELRFCVACGWVAPSRQGGENFYVEVDIARIRFIREMRHELNINDDAVPVLLSLIDQLHSLRHDVRLMARSIGEQPEDVRQAIADTFKALTNKAE